MAIEFILTDAGKEAMAQVGQVGPVKIDKIVIGSMGYIVSASQTSLRQEIKRLKTVGSSSSGKGIIHVTATDNSTDEYTVREVGLLSEDGTLIAVYAQEAPIIIKAPGSVNLLAFDWVITSVPPENITLGDAQFQYPPATESTKGVAQIATQSEVDSGTDDYTIVTPLKLSTKLTNAVKVATESAVRIVADSITGGRNRIINGGMAIDQRYNENPKTITSSYEYCIDRWFAAAHGAAITGQLVSTSDGYAYRLSGAKENTRISFGQRIESRNCKNLGNTVCQLSFIAYSSSITTLKCELLVPQAPDDWTRSPIVMFKDVEIDRSPKRYSISFTTNKNAANGVWLDFVTEGLLEDQTIHFADVQIEKGIQPTPFEYRPIGLELSLCQRYYEKVACNFDGHLALHQPDAQLRQLWSFCVPKRTSSWAYKVDPLKADAGHYPTASEGGIIAYKSERCFISQIQVASGGEWAWEIAADAEL